MAKKEKKEKKETAATAEEELRSIIAQIEALRAEIAVINQAIAELQTTQATLATIRDLGKGKALLIPVGAGVQVEAKVEDVEEVVIGIGGNLSVELPYDEAIEYLQKRVLALRDQRRVLEEAIAALYTQAEQLLAGVSEE